MIKRKSKYDVEIDVGIFRSKLQDELEQGLEINLKPNCYLIDNKIFMICARCGEAKERTSANFAMDHARDTKKHFSSYRAGWEPLQNSESTPCVECKSKLFKTWHRTEDGFIKNLVSSYVSTGLSIEWFRKILQEQGGKGPISGTILQLITKKVNCVSIHKYDNSKEHTPDNCFLEVQEINVAQWEAIPCLFCAWKNLFTKILDQYMNEQDNSEYLSFVRSQYFVKPKDIDIIHYNAKYYNKQKLYYHFPSILNQAIKNHIRGDIENKRFAFPDNIDRLEFVKIVYHNSIKQLEKQLWKCAYTDVNMSIENLWTRFSFERINGILPHFTQLGELTNIIFVCRLLNASRQLSKDKIIVYFLHQNLVPIPDWIRFQINPHSSKDDVAPALWTKREIDLLEFTSLKPNNTSNCNYCFLKKQIKINLS
jgi:hypothetical protein